jgi:hypothetical protein
VGFPSRRGRCERHCDLDTFQHSVLKALHLMVVVQAASSLSPKAESDWESSCAMHNAQSHPL